MSVQIYYLVLLGVVGVCAVLIVVTPKLFDRVTSRLPLLFILVVCVTWLAAVAGFDWVRGQRRTPGFTVVRSVPEARHALLLIHGWTGDSGTWSALIPLIVADNRFDAFEVATVDYASTNLLDRTVTLHQMAAKIRLAIGSRLAGRKTVIVTHSTGGVLARQIILDEWARPEPSLTIERLVSLAPPHGGSDVAQTAGFLGVIQIMLRELQERSTYLAELNTSWRVAASTFAETCIFAGRDGIVTSMSATRGCVHSLKLDGWGHAEVHRPAFNGDGRYIAISAALTEPLR